MVRNAPDAPVDWWPASPTRPPPSARPLPYPPKAAAAGQAARAYRCAGSYRCGHCRCSFAVAGAVCRLFELGLERADRGAPPCSSGAPKDHSLVELGGAPGRPRPWRGPGESIDRPDGLLRWWGYRGGGGRRRRAKGRHFTSVSSLPLLQEPGCSFSRILARNHRLSPRHICCAGSARWKSWPHQQDDQNSSVQGSGEEARPVADFAPGAVPEALGLLPPGFFSGAGCPCVNAKL